MNTLLIVLQQQSNGLMNFLPLILIIVVFWFFMIRPQMKRQKELKNFRDSLKKGDKIVTTGGIYGKVLEIGDYYIIMEVEGQNRLKIDKSAVIKDMTDVRNDWQTYALTELRISGFSPANPLRRSVSEKKADPPKTDGSM